MIVLALVVLVLVVLVVVAAVFEDCTDQLPTRTGDFGSGEFQKNPAVIIHPCLFWVWVKKGHEI